MNFEIFFYFFHIIFQFCLFYELFSHPQNKLLQTGLQRRCIGYRWHNVVYSLDRLFPTLFLFDYKLETIVVEMGQSFLLVCFHSLIIPIFTISISIFVYFHYFHLAYLITMSFTPIFVLDLLNLKIDKKKRMKYHSNYLVENFLSTAEETSEVLQIQFIIVKTPYNYN